MQGLRTHDAMRHAGLTLPAVWNHFLNMGGAIGLVEVDAYLHGLLPLPLPDRDCLTQAVNELLDDHEMTGTSSCCRAPYNAFGTAHLSAARCGSGDEAHDEPNEWPPLEELADPLAQPLWQPRYARRMRRPEA